jgi:outer membrane protein assembly factor BamB
MSHRIFTACAVAVTFGSVFASEPEWPQFRGPGALGVAAKGATPPTQFGLNKNVKWVVDLPSGISSPVIAGDHLFLTSYDGGKLLVHGFHRSTGKELWKTEVPAKSIEKFHKTEGSAASSTCVTDGTIVVSYFGSCGLVCHDMAGKELWRYDMPTAKTHYDFGTGVSPILADGKVILLRDLKTDSKLFAIDARTGSLVWETKREGFPTSWSTPAIWETPTGKQIVVPCYGRMAAYDLANGKEIWTVKGMPAACCTTPLVHDGMLIFAGWSPGEDFKLPPFEKLLEGVDADGDGRLSKTESDKSMMKGMFENNDPNGDGFITKEEWDANLKFMAACLNSAFAVKPGGTGDISASHVAWKVTNKKVLPYVPTGIVTDGALYLIKDGGLLSAYDVKSGKAIYESERVGSAGQYYASPVAANGHLYLTALNGDVHVVKTGEVPEVVFKGKLNDRTAATPAIVGDTIYVRTAKKLYAFAGK